MASALFRQVGRAVDSLVGKLSITTLRTGSGMAGHISESMAHSSANVRYGLPGQASVRRRRNGLNLDQLVAVRMPITVQ